MNNEIGCGGYPPHPFFLYWYDGVTYTKGRDPRGELRTKDAKSCGRISV